MRKRPTWASSSACRCATSWCPPTTTSYRCRCECVPGGKLALPAQAHVCRMALAGRATWLPDPPYTGLKLSRCLSDNQVQAKIGVRQRARVGCHDQPQCKRGGAPMFSPGHSGANAYARVGVET